MKIDLLDNEEAQFQMAPMIDMVFLLLVFFMCASHLCQTQNIKLDIPEATKAVVPKDRPDRWTVNIKENGDLFEGDKPVDIEALKEHVKAKVATNPKLKIYLRADQHTTYKKVKKVMNAMAAVGISDFIFGVYIPTQSQQAGK